VKKQSNMESRKMDRRTAIKVAYIGLVVLLLGGTGVSIAYDSAISAMSCVLALASIVLSVSLTLIITKWNGEDLQRATNDKLLALQTLSQEQIEANRAEFTKLLNVILETTKRQIDKLDESKTEQLHQIQKSTESQIENSRLEFEKLVRTIESSTKDQVNALTSSTKFQLEKLEETTNRHIDKIERTNHEQIEELRKTTEAQITANQKEFQKLVDSIGASTREQISVLIDSTEKHLQKIEESTDKHLNKLELTTKQQLQEHDKNTSRHISELKKSTTDQIVANRSEFEKLILSIAEANARQLQKMEEEISTINSTSDNQIQNFIQQCQDIIYRAEQNNLILCKMLEMQLKDSLTKVSGEFSNAKAQLAEIEKWKLFRLKSTRENQINAQYQRMQQIQNRMMAIGQELQQLTRLRIG
jgi:DNA repair exonuclease SbcCD ATPase subunit